METFSFHLMPYRAVEGRAWPYPNDSWDPETGARFYREYFRQHELAAELGFDGLGFNEHHFSAYGLQPSPVVTASYMAARTDDITLGFFGNVLPIRSNPVRVAEELAMLDNISEGRVLAGFPRGIPVEYLAYNVPLEDSRPRFEEALDLVQRTWTADEPFDHHGEFFDFEGVYAWPRPYQQPHPPVWVAAESEESLRFAAENRFQVGTGFGTAEEIGERFEMYDKFAEEAGWTPTDADKTVIQNVYVAETEERAREESEEHFEFFFERLFGGVHLGATARMMGDDVYDPDKHDVYMENLTDHGRQAFDFDYESAQEGLNTVGSPADVAGKIERLYEETGGFGRLAAGFHFGTLPPELTEKNLELYADEVMPEVRKL